MTAILTSLRNTVIVGLVLTAVLAALYLTLWNDAVSKPFWSYFFRWAHVVSGVMWIGLLWYFNFVQTPTVPKIPDELKPALGKHITPAALFWFRWGAMATLATGVVLAWLNGYIGAVLSLDATHAYDHPGHIALSIGVWLAIIMWFNVWFVIWPNQQKALNIGGRHPDVAADAKAKAAKTAGQFSRINTLLSFPMLFSMVAAQGLFGIS